MEPALPIGSHGKGDNAGSMKGLLQWGKFCYKISAILTICTCLRYRARAGPAVSYSHWAVAIVTYLMQAWWFLFEPSGWTRWHNFYPNPVQAMLARTGQVWILSKISGVLAFREKKNLNFYPNRRNLAQKSRIRTRDLCEYSGVPSVSSVMLVTFPGMVGN